MELGRLDIVPTPIGNLGDITERAKEVLSSCDLILAEDTRTTGNLLRHLGIDKPMKSFHLHNEHKAVNSIVAALSSGLHYALCSDAGTPGISDPGFLLVRECVNNNIEIDCLPGATAFVPALVNSGLPCEKFVFEGFLPQKKGRQTRLILLAEEKRTMVFYESPYRVLKTLRQFVEFMGEDRQVSVSREITKRFEETIRGTVSEVLTYFENNDPKGEFVIVLQGKS